LFATIITLSGCDKNKKSVSAKSVHAKALSKINSIKRYEAQFDTIRYNFIDGIGSDLSKRRWKIAVDMKVVLPNRMIISTAEKMLPEMPQLTKMFVVTDGEWVFNEKSAPDLELASFTYKYNYKKVRNRLTQMFPLVKGLGLPRQMEIVGSIKSLLQDGELQPGVETLMYRNNKSFRIAIKKSVKKMFAQRRQELGPPSDFGYELVHPFRYVYLIVDAQDYLPRRWSFGPDPDRPIAEYRLNKIVINQPFERIVLPERAKQAQDVTAKFEKSYQDPEQIKLMKTATISWQRELEQVIEKYWRIESSTTSYPCYTERRNPSGTGSSCVRASKNCLNQPECKNEGLGRAPIRAELARA